MAFRAQNARAAAGRIGDGRAGVRAQELRTEIVTSLGQPGKGRTYTHHLAQVNGHLVPVRKRAKPHVASAPGDTPATDTGRLKQSIAVKKIGAGHYRVGTNVEYAPLLEFGTRKVAARPFIRPAVDRVKSRG